MSVEKHTESEAYNAASCDIRHLVDSNSVVGEYTIHEGMESRESLHLHERYDEAPGNWKGIAVSTRATGWFQRLNSVERSAALSFSDGAFLGAFLSFASPWSPTTPGSLRDASESSMNWDHMVSFSDFEAKYEEYERGFGNTPKLATRNVPSFSSGVVREDGACNDGTGERERHVDASSYIIETSTSPEYRLAPVQTSANRAKASGEIDSFQQFFEQVTLIFPSTLKRFSGSIEQFPHVIVRPAYFDTATVEEQFFALTSSEGLVLADSNQDSHLWLRRLSGGRLDDHSVPLHSFLLARFEWAVWESFLEFERRSTTLHENVTGSIGESLESNLVAMSSKNSKDPRKHFLLAILRDVLFHCGTMNALTRTIDSASLAGVVAPFVDACVPQKNSSALAIAIQAENLVLTPLSWLALSKEDDGLSYLGILDAAVDTSLRRMDDRLKQAPIESDKPEVVRLDKATSGSSACYPFAGQSYNPDQSLRKKRKGKKKKNKKPRCAERRSTEDAPKRLQQSIENEALASGVVEAVDINSAVQLAQERNEVDYVTLDEVNVPKCLVLSEFSEPDSTDNDSANEDAHELPPSDAAVDKKQDVSFRLSDGRRLVDLPLPNAATASAEASTDNNHDEDCWETVEIRRGGRKKTSTQFGVSRLSIQSSTAMSSNGPWGGSCKKPKGMRSILSRKKSAARRAVREILFLVIDSVEDTSRRRKPGVTSAPRTINSWNNGPPGAVDEVPVGAIAQVTAEYFVSVAANAATSENSLRSVAAGKCHSALSIESARLEDLDNCVLPGEGATIIRDNSTRSESNGSKEAKTNPGTTADQNTAPTYQDTASTSTNARPGSNQEPGSRTGRKGDSSASEIEEAPQSRDLEVSSSDAIDSNTPPLPTLLSPENANSATSSVASSLEAPHAGRMHRHSIMAVDAIDVGYHLLDVCDRLSRDMDLFMSRRALALTARRQERGALLVALQKSVSSIWPARGHVELYGSCATQLDLPASDIDVVVVGSHRHSAQLQPSIPGVSQSNESRAASLARLPMDETNGSVTNDEQQESVQMHLSAASFGTLHVHRNAERVLLLAADLEDKPWAVQVHAIPTASVPVVKVLADPSKIAISTNGEELMASRKQVAAQAAAPAKKVQSPGCLTNNDSANIITGSYPHPTLLPWRGSDVMKGLLSLDVTFEGPEHGGIGSTEFSSRTVAEACEESGLHADATPFVQVLMVLKELLAQRKLNEPYSGGLSSYALLLLVLALIRERAVIREEIELVEQQKIAMAAGEQSSFGMERSSPFPVNDFPAPALSLQPGFERKDSSAMAAMSSSPTSQIKLGSKKKELLSKKPESGDSWPLSKKNTKNAFGESKRQSQPRTVGSARIYPPSSSWAAIAKKSFETIAPQVANTSKPNGEFAKAQNATLKSAQKPSFAEAVARSSATRHSTPAKSLEKEATRNNQNTNAPIEPSFGESVMTPEEVSPQVVAGAASVCAAPLPPIRTPVASPENSMPRVAPPFYPQGYNDIVEVLCSGETTAGKLLMHFLLYYGQHFDSQSTAVDVSGKHERGASVIASCPYFSPYIQRGALGNIDPITGMLTVDPIVIYDPLEGCENNNVAKRCFAWNSVRWIFAQSYATLASAVEKCSTPPATPGGSPTLSAPSRVGCIRESGMAMFNPDGDLMDPSPPLLRCLLSF